MHHADKCGEITGTAKDSPEPPVISIGQSLGREILVSTDVRLKLVIALIIAVLTIKGVYVC